MKKSDKSELRTHFCTLRECLPAEEIAAASAALCRRLAAWSALREVQTVLTYHAFRSEPDLSLLFDLLPSICWAAPRIEGKELVIHPYDPTRLMRHRFGMLEPAADLPVIDPARLDVVLVPGVAFDRRGGRLGFGGGFYDGLLPTTRTLRVGVTHNSCLADRLPMLAHDQWMDWVVTPAQLIQCPARPR